MRPELLVLSYLVCFSVLGVWLGFTETQKLKEQLAWLTPIAIQISFLLLVTGGWAARKTVARTLRGAGRAVGILAIAALIAVSLFPPRTHRIYYDEDIYQNVAQNVLWRGKAQMCNEGTVEHGRYECVATEYNKEPNAFPFLLSFVFRFTGVNETSAHILNHLLFALGVVCAYWVGILLFRDRRAALAAAAIYLLTPENLLWGATVAVEPGAATFAALAVGAWLLFLEDASVATALFAAGSIAFASQWRPESVLILVVAAFATLILKPARLLGLQLYATALLVLFLLLPHLGHLWAVRNQGWGSGEEGKFALVYVLDNLRANVWYFVEGKEFPLYFCLLAIVGLATFRNWRQKPIPLLWFLLFFGIFIPFHAGSFRYGADIRFSLLSAMPVALLGGLGAAWLADRLEGWFRDRRWVATVPLVVAVYVFTAYLPLVRSVGREAWEARADHDIAREMIELVPDRSMVLTHNPGMLHVMGQSAAQTSHVAYQPSKVDHFFRQFPGGVYFHFNFWCNVHDPVQNEFCTKVLKTYPTQVIEEWSAGMNRYVLYRLLPRRGNPPETP
jgi:4-amino-4-deoxy-L-arabinose transferase-like glycosyltransferase